ncbi:type II toxin-antitoxin system VapC family toxin [Pseudokineococcus basanitobsidens]|uniref:Ribonuclease VapC n=1 Tax=Pseudokineococcus basanitobsidens TaxID=1926649 RepID=A0ABU8RMX6_9ACTN
MTPTGGETPTLLDTSAAVPFLVQDHEDHGAVFDALETRTLGLAGHAAFETHSVLTRLRPPARRTPASAAVLLEANFPATCFLPDVAARALLARLARLGVAGGHVYDALVGAATVEHGLTLATRDRRALEVYAALGVAVELV